MFEGDSADMCAGTVPLMSMGGRAWAEIFVILLGWIGSGVNNQTILEWGFHFNPIRV